MNFTLSRGTYYGALTVLLMSIMDVFSRIGVIVFGAAPALYAAVSLFTSAMILIIIAGPGKGGMGTIRSLHTWLYAILQIIFGVTEVYVYSLSTTIEGTILLRFTIIVSLIGALIVFNRKPSKSDIIGALMVGVGVLYVAWTLPVEVKILTTIAFVTGSILLVARTFITETHPTSIASCGVKDQCRVTGFVLIITSVMFILAYAIAGYLFHLNGADDLVSGLPSLDDFQNFDGTLAAVIAGIFIIAPAKYFFFYSSKLIKTENYMALTSIAFIFVVIMEYVLYWCGVISIDSVNWDDLVAGTVVMFGALYMIFEREKDDRITPVEPV